MKRLLEIKKLVEYLLDDLPKVTISEDEKLWDCRNRWALGIKNEVEELLNGR